jgi:small-conductance mechanosensitive channel
VHNARTEVVVDSLSDTAVTLAARVPVRSGEWMAARSELQERLMATLDRERGFSPATA